MCRSVRSAACRRCRKIPEPAGPITGRAPRACCPGPSRSRPWRCCLTMRRPGYPGAGWADGPERVFGEWWKRDAELVAVRGYFRIEDETGERYWIFHAGDGEDPATGSQRWFLHGVFG